MVSLALRRHRRRRRYDGDALRSGKLDTERRAASGGAFWRLRTEAGRRQCFAEIDRRLNSVLFPIRVVRVVRIVRISTWSSDA